MPPYDGGAPAAAPHTNIAKARARIGIVRDDLESKRSEQVIIQNAAKLGILGGTAGALVSGLYGGSRDLIVGFGLAGGGSYVLGETYAPPGTADAYLEGLGALICLDKASLPAFQIVDRLAAAGVRLNAAVSELSASVERISKTGRDGSHLGVAREKINTAAEVKASADSVIARYDTPTAANLDVALSGVVHAVSKRLRKEQTSYAGVASAARNIVTIGLAGIDPAVKGGRDAAAAIRKSGTQRPPQVSSSLTQDDIKELQSKSDIVASLTKSLSDAIPQNEQEIEKFEGCTIADVTTGPLAVAPSAEPKVKADAPFVVFVSGGRTPYTAQPLGTTTDKIDIDRVSRDGTFVVRTKAGTASGEKLTVKIDDYSSPPLSTTLTITVE